MVSHAPIYKLTSRADWLEAEAQGRFEGAPIDLADGFVHFSTGAQLRETAERHFAGVVPLVMVAVDPALLGDALRWEPSRGGDLFPHLYASLPLDAVLYVEDVPADANGAHVFPASVR